MTTRRPLLTALLLASISWTSVPLGATTYVVVSDASLLAASPLVVEGRVVGRETGSGPYTDYRVEVERWLKASGERSIRVRLPGGTDRANRTLRVEGMPRLAPAQRVLLFLSQRDDGTYVPTHLGLGVFLRVEHSAGALAVRDTGNALLLEVDGGPAIAERSRDYERFATWIAGDRPGGDTADYWVDPPAAGGLRSAAPFNFFEVGGVNLRWVEFDTGGSVTFFANQNGQPGLPGGGFAEFQAALAAWTDHPTTPIDYRYGGTTAASGGLTEFDGINAIQFDDPNATSLFGGPYDCDSGGTLAVGGPWFGEQTHDRDGTPFLTIAGADVVTNTNVSCFLALNGGSNAEEVFAHELGHTLGLAHSCGDDATGPCDTPVKREALMNALARGDGRGARIGEDDSAAIDLVYGFTGTGCIPDLATLCLDGTPGDRRFSVTVRFDSALGGGISGAAPTKPLAQVGIPKGGVFSFFDPQNPELLVKVLDGCSINQRYWVFYAATTNLGFELTVTDTKAGEEKTYANPDLTIAVPVTDTEALATCP